MAFEREVAETDAWLSSERFAGITRLHTARQVIEQRGAIPIDYPVARGAAEGFYARLRELFAARQAITTFGPYSPGQAVTMKRLGFEGIYLGGWATSARGSVTEDPGADLASYPLSQVPDEGACLVRALLTADRNQRFARARMSDAQLSAAPEIDYRPFIIADADTGHGGEPHVRNLIRRFVEAGVPGCHIEDQKPGLKKCGHQGGKVLVAQTEQVQRLNAARLQLDVMKVPGILVARTDAEAANLLDSNGDERDHPFILGATNLDVPSYKSIVLAVHRTFFDLGVAEIRGHLMFDLPEAEYRRASEWLTPAGVTQMIVDKAAAFDRRDEVSIEAALGEVTARFLESWQRDARLRTRRDALADGMPWDAELARTPEGFYQVQGGLGYAIARSLTFAPFADILWMETATANLDEAREYAEAIHAVFPDKMLAYNLSPSFNWDTTGMTDEEMKRFPEELGKLGFVFNFITYGGHQIDGAAAEEFAISLQQEGMLALARLQRRIRLLESPYRTPQTLVGGPRVDAALMASSGRTATTKAMGKGSTQHQHLKETEASPDVLERWLRQAQSEKAAERLSVTLRPVTGGSDLVRLRILGQRREHANIVFLPARDGQGRRWLSILEQQAFDGASGSTRAMTLAHLFLFHRYKPATVQFMSAAAGEDGCGRELESLGLLTDLESLAGRFTVADVNGPRVDELLASGIDRLFEPRLLNTR